MPWKAKDAMDLKREFIKRLSSGERMSELCREYGISREYGYRLKERFGSDGDDGLQVRSRRPRRSPKQIVAPIVDLVLEARRAHPTWGPHKLKQMLERDKGIKLPATSTIGGLLKKHGLIVPRRKRSSTVSRWKSGLREATQANDVWCVDYKGQFRLGDGSHCYPLTLTDQHTRFILGCEGMSAIDGEQALETMLYAFGRYGLPEVIRSDNGSPFAAVRALAGLSKLSAAWMRLGIVPERIDPGQPQQNGRHERMHLTLKQDTTRPASANLLAQQERFDRFVEEFNTVRPHEALDGNTPANVYHPSTRSFSGVLPEPDYPTHDDVVVVASGGHVRVGRHYFFLSAALADHPVGIREEDDGRWLISFMSLDLGHLDSQTGRFNPLSTEPTP
jgi:transposase InsO family protein